MTDLSTTAIGKFDVHDCTATLPDIDRFLELMNTLYFNPVDGTRLSGEQRITVVGGAPFLYNESHTVARPPRMTPISFFPQVPEVEDVWFLTRDHEKTKERWGAYDYGLIKPTNVPYSAGNDERYIQGPFLHWQLSNGRIRRRRAGLVDFPRTEDSVDILLHLRPIDLESDRTLRYLRDYESIFRHGEIRR